MPDSQNESAPERIRLLAHTGFAGLPDWDEVWVHPNGTEFIRASVVEGLVEALRACEREARRLGDDRDTRDGGGHLPKTCGVLGHPLCPNCRALGLASAALSRYEATRQKGT